MAKDPAFLFYSSDFLTGTMLMSNEQRGKYITLLCFQHQHGHLSEQDMLKICSTHDSDIFAKFEKDDDGLYFNERLEAEVEKRKAYSESRKKNRGQKASETDMSIISSTYVRHMENENEIVNEDKDNIGGKSSRFIPPTLEEVTAYCKEKQNGVDPVIWWNFYDSKNWYVGKNKMVRWKSAIATWGKGEDKPSEQPKPKAKQYKPVEINGEIVMEVVAD